MKNLFLVLGLICLFTNSYSQTNSKKLPDGIYIVSESPGDTAHIKKDTSMTVVPFNVLFKENAPGTTAALLLFKKDYVPLAFSKKPALSKQSDGTKRLDLVFTKASADKLSELTLANINKQAAIVINGEAITAHRIVAAIRQGKMQISGCHENSCERIRQELMKYVK